MDTRAQLVTEQVNGNFERQEDPTRIVPLGPILELSAPHGRERLSS